MRVEISKKPLIDRAVLEELGEVRLRDANVLYERERYGATVYLAGYAVECYLKAAICARLAWEALYPTFKIHDLDVLLLHTGLASEIAKAPDVEQSFRQIVGVWKMEGRDNIRYMAPGSLTKNNAQDFLQWVQGARVGVVPVGKGADLAKAARNIERTLRDFVGEREVGMVHVFESSPGLLRAVVGSARFRNMGLTERQKVVWEYLKAHMDEADLQVCWGVHPMDPEEYNEEHLPTSSSFSPEGEES